MDIALVARVKGALDAAVLTLEGGYYAYTATAVVLLLALAFRFLARHKSGSLDAKMPGFLGIPIIHDDLFTTMSLETSALRKWNLERHKRYGEIFRTRFLISETIVVNNWEMVKKLFSSEHSLVQGAFPPSVTSIIGPHSLLSLKGTAHLQSRRVIARLFTGATIRSYLPGIQRIISARLERWASTDGTVKTGPEAKEIAFDLLMELVMGVDPSEAQAVVGARSVMELLRDISAGLFSLPINLPGTRFRKAMAARRVILKLIDVMLSQALSPEQLSGGKRSILQLLVEARDESGEPLPTEQLQDTCVLLMFAGHDTTASAMTVMLQQLALHPEALQKLRAEQQQVVAAHGEELSDAAMRDMVYAEAVVKEVMRVNPIVPAVPRVALQKFELGAFTIEKGTKLNLGISRPMYYAPQWQAGGELDPDLFYPDRWLTEAGATAPWMPFGHGTRMCVGYPLAVAELKVLAGLLGRGYTWEIVDPQEKWSSFPTPLPSKGFPLTFSKTQHT